MALPATSLEQALAALALDTDEKKSALDTLLDATGLGRGSLALAVIRGPRMSGDIRHLFVAPPRSLVPHVAFANITRLEFAAGTPPGLSHDWIMDLDDADLSRKVIGLARMGFPPLVLVTVDGIAYDSGKVRVTLADSPVSGGLAELSYGVGFLPRDPRVSGQVAHHTCALGPMNLSRKHALALDHLTFLRGQADSHLAHVADSLCEAVAAYRSANDEPQDRAPRGVNLESLLVLVTGFSSRRVGLGHEYAFDYVASEIVPVFDGRLDLAPSPSASDEVNEARRAALNLVAKALVSLTAPVAALAATWFDIRGVRDTVRYLVKTEDGRQVLSHAGVAAGTPWDLASDAHKVLVDWVDAFLENYGASRELSHPTLWSRARPVSWNDEENHIAAALTVAEMAAGAASLGL